MSQMLEKLSREIRHSKVWPILYTIGKHGPNILAHILNIFAYGILAIVLCLPWLAAFHYFYSLTT